MTGCNFGIGPGSRVSGYAWHDLNADTHRDSNEPGLNGWTIYIDVNGNGRLDNAKPSVVTQNDAQGHPGYYELTGLAAGNYTFAEVRQTGWTQTAPADPGVYSIHLDLGQNSDAVDFGNHANPGSIFGYVWNDLNADGDWDTAEPGLNGWTVYLDANGNGQFDAGEPSVLTHNDPQGNPGYYEFRISFRARLQSTKCRAPVGRRLSRSARAYSPSYSGPGRPPTTSASATC